MEETGKIETDRHSCYYYSATFIRKVLQGQEVDFAQEGYSWVDDEGVNKLFFDNSASAMLLKRFLVMIDFIDDLNDYRDETFDTIFGEFFDISPEMTKFIVSDALLAQIEELSPNDCQLVRKKLSEFWVSDDKFHSYLLNLLEASSTLSSVMQALASASSDFAAYYLKTLNTNGKRKCKLMGEIFLDGYKFNQYQEDLQDYNEWLSNYAPINFEDELSRKMGYYMDKLYQTNYLKPYRDSVRILFDYDDDCLYYGGYPYRYNYRGFLAPMDFLGYMHDLFLWKKHELVEFTILRNRFPNLELDAVGLGKLIIENRINYSVSNVMTLIACFKFYHKIKSSLYDVINSNDHKLSHNYHYRDYLEHMNINIPELMVSQKACQVWHEFMEEKYIVRKSMRYDWIHNNNREFGYFVYYAQQFFYKQHAQKETINWGTYCFLFSQDVKNKRSYESGCSEIARLERCKAKLPGSASRIKKIFRRVS